MLAPLTSDQLATVMRARRAVCYAPFDSYNLFEHPDRDALYAIGERAIVDSQDPMFAALYGEYLDEYFCSTPMIADALNLIAKTELAARAEREQRELAERRARSEAARQQRIDERMRNEHRCLHCHRVLTDPASIARGYGPECAAKVAA